MSFPSRPQRVSLLLGTLALFTTPGCTLVGYGLGSAVDLGLRRSASVETLDTNVVAPGKKVDVYLSDDSKLTGIFRGLQPTPAPEYARSYLAARRSLPLGVSLPTPGDSVTLYTTSRPPLRGVFLGYDPGAVVLATAKGTVAVSVLDLQELDFARGRAPSADVRSAIDDSQSHSCRCCDSSAGRLPRSRFSCGESRGWSGGRVRDVRWGGSWGQRSIYI